MKTIEYKFTSFSLYVMVIQELMKYGFIHSNEMVDTIKKEDYPKVFWTLSATSLYTVIVVPIDASYIVDEVIVKSKQG